ncbi:MAG: phage tail tape measure protein, family [Firmicutes bacterium]|nr:phage tail tape measure protein, family [Bacillota bacterium]
MANRKTFEVAFEIAGKLGATFQGAFSSATAQMQRLGAQSNALKSNLKTLDSTYKQGVISVESYKNAQAKLKAQLEETRGAQAKLAAAQSLRNESSKRAGDIRGKMFDTAVMAAPLIAATKAAVDFETAMGDVAKQVNGARDDAGNLTDVYYQMRANTMQLSEALRVPPSEIAAITASAARMGVQGTDALNEFVKMSVEMGVAFDGSGEQIAEQMAKIANIRGIKIDTAEGREQIRDLADTINYLDDQSVAKGPEIIEVMQRISGTAAQSSFSNGELAALATTMLSLGKSPEVASTGLNALMNKLAAAPSQAKSFQEALAALNIDAKELQTSYMSDSKGTIFGLMEKIQSLDKPQQAEILTGLFGAEYQDDMSSLAAGLDTLKTSFSQLDAEGRKGSMDKEFQAKMKLVSSAIEGTKAATERLSVSLATSLLPGVNAMAGIVAGGAQHVANFQQKFPGLTNAIVATATGLVGFRLAWLGVSFIMNQYRAQKAAILILERRHSAQMVINRTQTMLSAAATGTVTAAQWLWNAALSANPIGLVIVGIGALIAVGYLLYQNWDAIKAFFVTLWNDPSAAIDQFCVYFHSQIDSILNWVSEKWEWIKGIFSTPIQANVQANATAGGENQIYANAAGGIYGQGTFLTTFAEESDEAAIPLDGSPRAVSLWQKAGDMLGVSMGGGTTIQVTFAPVIHGDGQDIMPELQRQQDNFMEQLKETVWQQGRVALG